MLLICFALLRGCSPRASCLARAVFYPPKHYRSFWELSCRQRIEKVISRCQIRAAFQAWMWWGRLVVRWCFWLLAALFTALFSFQHCCCVQGEHFYCETASSWQHNCKNSGWILVLGCFVSCTLGGKIFRFYFCIICCCTRNRSL